MEDEFFDQQQNLGVGIRNFSETWVQYILEFPMPKIEEEREVKETIIHMLTPVMNVSARSNLRRPDIPLHLWAYDIIWQKYFVYKRRGRYDPDLLVLKESLREGFELMLNRSVEMGQMRMIFEPKQSIFQRLVTGRDRKLSFFKHKKEENQNMEE